MVYEINDFCQIPKDIIVPIVCVACHAVVIPLLEIIDNRLWIGNKTKITVIISRHRFLIIIPYYSSQYSLVLSATTVSTPVDRV